MISKSKNGGNSVRTLYNKLLKTSVFCYEQCEEISSEAYKLLNWALNIKPPMKFKGMVLH